MDPRHSPSSQKDVGGVKHMPKMKMLLREELGNSIGVVLGTRPGIIKMSPLINEFVRRKLRFFVIHTGQHYSRNMSEDFFKELELPRPDYHISGVEQSYFHGEQTAIMLTGVERILLKEKPACALVGGDANTNLAGGLAARKLGIQLGHVEAGLRSHDWRTPEEHNRVILDHISDFLFAPTLESKRNLIRESVRGRIYVVGNTIADAIQQGKRIADRRSEILNRLNLRRQDYIVATLHREENVDNPERLRMLITRLSELTSAVELPTIFPVHPRTEARIRQFRLTIPERVVMTSALPYLDFLNLLDNASLVVTDSGGIQEESCILHVPCVTVREKTERPETVEAGANIITGLTKKPFLDGCMKQLGNERVWRNPYAAGAAKAIVSVLERQGWGG